MAFTIKIYEKDHYIYSLLKKRLICFFPEAYIVNPFFDDTEYEDRFSTSTRVIYDPSDISIEDVPYGSSSPIRLTEDSRIVDCSRLIRLLSSEEVPSVISRSVTGSFYAVLPFVYIDVRENFLKSLSTDLSDSEFNIRLDLTSKLRAPYKNNSGCNMTSLLEACRSKKFMPDEILKYCNMDETGFLTPGTTKDYDDVYDAGTERSVTLMHHAASLAHTNTKFVNVVSVLEGFKTKELPNLLCECDKVLILLPSVDTGEEIGARDLTSLLTKTLGKERLSICYAEDINDEFLSPGRLVV